MGLFIAVPDCRSGLVDDPAARENPARAAHALLAAFGRKTDDCAVLCLRLAQAGDRDMAPAP